MTDDRMCPYCRGPMDLDEGPRDDPTEDGNVEIEAVWRCSVCRWEVAVHRHTWSDTEIQQRVAAVMELRDADGLDKRAEVLAEHGYTPGKRWWPPC